MVKGFLKKTTVFTLIFCLMFGAFGQLCFAEDPTPETTGTAEAAIDTENIEYPPGMDGQWMRIGIQWGDNAVESVELYCKDGFYVGQVDRKTVNNTFILDGELTAEIDGVTSISLNPGDYPNGTVFLSKGDDPATRNVRINGKNFRDGFIFYTNEAQKIHPISYLTLEHYVWGVVGNEMGYNYPIEALKAQALTARSYALTHLNHHWTAGFDLCSTGDCQVYRGLSSEYDSTVRACRETEGKVISYDGKIASTFYYAASGGYTMNSEDVWSTKLPYVRGVKDEYCSEYVWTAAISFTELAARMKNAGYDVEEIHSVEVSKTLDNGAVYQIVVHHSKGDSTLTKNNVMSVMGGTTVKSQFFSLSGDPETDYEKQEIGGLNMESDESSARTEEAVYVLGADGEAVLLELPELSVTDGEESVSAESDVRTEFVFTHELVEDGTLYFKGLGYGHGVGLPQTSARNMAEAGKCAMDIIDFFYTDVEISSYRALRGEPEPAESEEPAEPEESGEAEESAEPEEPEEPAEPEGPAESEEPSSDGDSDSSAPAYEW